MWTILLPRRKTVLTGSLREGKSSPSRHRRSLFWITGKKAGVKFHRERRADTLSWRIKVGPQQFSRFRLTTRSLSNSPPLSPSCRNGSNSPMAEGDPIRIIPHRGVDDNWGSLEVWFADGRASARFYWDNLVSRRLSANTLTREQAIEKATAVARAEMDKLDNPE